MARTRIPRPAAATEPVHRSPAAGARAAQGPQMAAQRRLLDRLLPAQREPLPEEEEEPLQARARPGGLPAGLQAGIAQLSGEDLSDVTVHRNSARPAQLDALAYAQGRDIHLGPGQERHLPHEAWHLVQQRQGRVAPTMEAGGVPVNDDPALEQEADRMGSRAAGTG